MITELEGYLHRGRVLARKWAADTRVRFGLTALGYSSAGLLISAASLGHSPMPLALGLITAVTGWRAPAMGLGSILGYWFFWGAAGYQGMVWAGVGALLALFLGKRRITAEVPLLMPAISALVVSATGLLFQLVWADDTSVPIYLLRVVMAAGTTGLYALALGGENALATWLMQGTFVLALAQVAPIPWLSLGFLAAGAMTLGDAFPAAAMAGLALDLAGVTPVPMAAALTLGYLIRLIPCRKPWAVMAAPVTGYLLVMGLSGTWDVLPLPGLLLGSIGGLFIPNRPRTAHRRGETGMAQVWLELMAGVLGQTQQLLLEADTVPIDEAALLHRTRERACGTCPNRKQCRDVVIPEAVLHRPMADTTSLPFPCRKPGRMLLELRRSQEQLRFLQGDRQRRREYREAVVQQYGFLAEYLRCTADTLARRGGTPRQRFTPEVAVCSAGKETANGDRCAWFSGTGCHYYILLCDGMGTGLGAAQEGQQGVAMLRQMLTAGFPAEYALRSLNSLTALRGRAGAVTVDLAQIDLTNGSAVLYKWGAAPSWLLREQSVEKIGTAAPPPGLSIAEARETVDRLSLRRGETLVLCSDGLDASQVFARWAAPGKLTPGELAAYLLERGGGDRGDDATCVAVQLGTSAS